MGRERSPGAPREGQQSVAKFENELRIRFVCRLAAVAVPRPTAGSPAIMTSLRPSTDLRRFDPELVLDERESALSSAPTRNTSAHDFQALAEGGVDASKVTSRLESLLDNNLLRVLSIRRSIDAAAQAPPAPFRAPTATLLERPTAELEAAAAPPPPTAARQPWTTWAPPWQFGGGPAVALAPLSPFLRCSSPTALPLDLGAAAPSGPPPS